MALRCAPTVAPITLASIARVESGKSSHALHNNTIGKSLIPADIAIAVKTASTWLAEGHSVDVGLMQINSGNFGWLGISVEDALEPCTSMAAAARILTEGFAGGQTEAQRQASLRVALSRYNTGSPERGFSNGYVGKVVAAARHVVPAIEVDGAEVTRLLSPTRDVTAPSNWDVWADTQPVSSFAVSHTNLSHDVPPRLQALPSVPLKKTARLSRMPAQTDTLYPIRKESLE